LAVYMQSVTPKIDDGDNTPHESDFDREMASKIQKHFFDEGLETKGQGSTPR